MKCLGINNRGNKCKRVVKCGQWCSFHIYQKPIRFYKRPLPYSNWPRVEFINHEIVKYPNIDLFMKALHICYLELQVNSSTLFYTESHINYARNKCLILTVELLKKNTHICYGESFLENIINSSIIILHKHPELRDYAEDFKKKCLKSYRDQAQKRVACFYFKYVEGLCFDVVEKIMGYV